MTREPDQTMDLRGTPCPLNWVKAKLRLEAMAAGQLLEIFIDDGEPVRNVPRSIRAEGHTIIEAAPMDGAFRLLVSRAGSDG